MSVNRKTGNNIYQSTVPTVATFVGAGLAGAGAYWIFKGIGNATSAQGIKGFAPGNIW